MRILIDECVDETTAQLFRWTRLPDGTLRRNAHYLIGATFGRTNVTLNSASLSSAFLSVDKKTKISIPRSG